MYLLSIMPKIK